MPSPEAQPPFKVINRVANDISSGRAKNILGKTERMKAVLRIIEASYNDASGRRSSEKLIEEIKNAKRIVEESVGLGGDKKSSDAKIARDLYEKKPFKDASLRTEIAYTLASLRGEVPVWLVTKASEIKHSPDAAEFIARIAAKPKELQSDAWTILVEIRRATLSADWQGMTTPARTELLEILGKAEEQARKQVDSNPTEYKDLSRYFNIALVETRRDTYKFYDEKKTLRDEKRPHDPSVVLQSEFTEDAKGTATDYKKFTGILTMIEQGKEGPAGVQYWHNSKELQKRANELRTIVGAPAEARDYYAGKLELRVLEIDRIKERVGIRREDEPLIVAKAEALYYRADKALREYHDYLTNHPHAVNPELQKIVNDSPVSIMEADSGRLFTSKGRIEELYNRRDVNGQFILQGNDRLLAEKLLSVTIDRHGFASWAEDYLAMQTGGREYHLFLELGFSDNDLKEFKRITGDPQSAVDYINETIAGGGSIEDVIEKTQKLFNKVFYAVDLNDSDAFEHTFDILRTKPVFDRFMKNLDEVHHTFRAAKSPYAERFERFWHKLQSEKDIREYAHNVNFLLRTRGDIKTMSGYAQRLHLEHFDIFMQDEKHVASAYRIFEKVMTKIIADNIWEIQPTWFSKIRGQGDLMMDNIREQFRISVIAQTGKEPEDWQVTRAVNIARGIIFGVTAIGLDRLAEARPPADMRHHGYIGYLGDSILSRFNFMQHHIDRWWPDDKKHKIVLYAQAKLKGSMEAYRMKQLYDAAQRHGGDILTNLNQTKDWDNIPIVQISNFFGACGLFSRDSWRFTGMIEHLVSKPVGVKVLEFEKMSNTDFETTWSNLGRAGSALQYFWADKLEVIKKELELGGHPGKVAEAIREKLNSGSLPPDFFDRYSKKAVFKTLMERNPLFFVWFDKTMSQPDPSRAIDTITKTHERYQFENTLRGKALLAIGVKTVDQIRGYPREAVRDDKVIRALDFGCIQISELMNSKHQFVGERGKRRFSSLQELEQYGPELLNRIFENSPDGWPSNLNWRDKTISYWKALQSQISQSNEEVLNEFSKRVFPYTLGSDDIDWDAIRLVDSAGTMVGRYWNDIAVLDEKTIVPSMNIHFMLDHIAKTGDFSAFEKYLDSAVAGIDMVHGEAAIEKFAYFMGLIVSRWVQKDITARLPLGIGSLIGLGGRSSWSQEAFGAYGYAADEQKLYGLIQQVIVGHLPPHARARFTNHKHKYNAIILGREVGASPLHVGVDIARSLIPTLLALVGLAGVTKSTEDEKDRHH